MNEILTRHATPQQIILDVMILCMIVGAIDYFRHNKWGLGKRFEDAFGAFFPLFLMMGGILTFVPWAGRLIAPVAGPLFGLTGSDPGMLPGMFLANDMGAFPLSAELANEPMAAGFGGMILGSILGVNIVFNIPAALGMIRKEDHVPAAKGFLFGFMAVPIGTFLGGLAAGYPIRFILMNMIPVILFSAFICTLMVLIPAKLIRAFIGFGKIISAAALIGIVLAITAELAGISPDALGINSVKTSLDVIGSIIIVLPGAYVLVELLGRILRRGIRMTGEKLHVNDTSVLGMLATLANDIPTFAMFKDMDERGKIMNCAFLVGGAFTFGDHLGFCAAVAPDLILPMIAAKLSTAAAGAALAWIFTRNLKKDELPVQR